MDVHAIIKGILHPIDLPACIYDLSGAVVVEHKCGLIQKERPHYHCWLPGVPSVPWQKTVLREYYDQQFPPGHLTWETYANAYYCVKQHDDFVTWLKYTFSDKVAAKCKSPSIVIWNRSDPRPDSPDVARSFDELILPTNVVTESPVVVPPAPPAPSKKKKDPAHIRLYNYCVDKGAFEPSMEEVANYWAEMTGGAYELRFVTGSIKYAFYKLNNYDPRIKAAFVREIMRVLPEIIL